MSQTQDQQLSEVELELVQGGAEVAQGIGAASVAPFAMLGAVGSAKSKG